MKLAALLLLVGCASAHDMRAPTVAQATWARAYAACGELQRHPGGDHEEAASLAVHDAAIASGAYLPLGLTAADDCASWYPVFVAQDASERQARADEVNAHRRKVAATVIGGMGNAMSSAGQPPARQPVTCTSLVSGNVVSTNCY